MASQITISISEGVCFQIIGDSNPQLEGQYQYANQEYQFMQLPIYKAITNVTITTTGSVVYWKC
jgi:hypothetical protein